jgi:dolichol-phosphate mannosyltransferase
LPRLRETLGTLGCRYEILVVDGGSHDGTRAVAERLGARVLRQTVPGYGAALQAGFDQASGSHILTLDADLSHSPTLVPLMWRHRHHAAIVIASRYVAGGRAEMSAFRLALSRVLNSVFRRALSLPVRDLSSGFRLYRASTVRGRPLKSTDFDFNQETLIETYAAGHRIVEVPFWYRPRGSGRSKAKLLRLGSAYVRTLGRMWRLRNSVASADYDDRAYDSVIPLQRFWQRRRFREVVGLCSAATLDVGCGSSRILSALPPGSLGLDLNMGKLRYARKFVRPLVQASGAALPIPDASLRCVLCSQVIEHVGKDVPLLEELDRVLAPGGRLVLGTPDYGRWEWRATEWLYKRAAPNAYADEHISPYTRGELLDAFRARGYVVEEVRYILRGELILALRKRRTVPSSTSTGCAA